MCVLDIYIYTYTTSCHKSQHTTICIKLRLVFQEFEIEKLAILCFGCDLDKLKWIQVRKIVQYIFHEFGVIAQNYSKHNLNDPNKMKIITEHHLEILGGHRGVQHIIQ